MLNDPFPPVHCRNAKWDWFNARNYCRWELKIKWTVSPDGELQQKRNRATAAVNYKETLYS